jgi:hypothetical protein|tara:strand:- start:416 stop:721 length:306 start_codon:yes stop_codon:yes gene_type:complete
MRSFDKNKNIAKANKLAEQRHLESKGLIKEADGKHMPIQKEITGYSGVEPNDVKESPLKNELIKFVEWLDDNVSYHQHPINMRDVDGYIRNKNEQEGLGSH